MSPARIRSNVVLVEAAELVATMCMDVPEVRRLVKKIAAANDTDALIEIRVAARRTHRTPTTRGAATPRPERWALGVARAERRCSIVVLDADLDDVIDTTPDSRRADTVERIKGVMRHLMEIGKAR
ncbi:MAG: hypothetical protein QM757_14780 [Paludibaculum sp.]